MYRFVPALNFLIKHSFDVTSSAGRPAFYFSSRMIKSGARGGPRVAEDEGRAGFHLFLAQAFMLRKLFLSTERNLSSTIPVRKYGFCRKKVP